MIIMNMNYQKLEQSYLFREIDRRVRLYCEEHPDRKLLRLGIGDVSQPLSQSVIRAMHEAVDDQAAKETFHGYMPEYGMPALRQAVAEHYQRRNISLTPAKVFVSSGASDELGDIVHLFDRSLPVILVEPAYPAYADVSVMDGREIIFVKADMENGFTPLPPEEMIRPLIYICSPNNPSGAVYTREKLAQWVDYASRTGSVILFDAAYESFITDENIPRSVYEIEGAFSCAIEICSLSKTAGFTGTRCGYTVIPSGLRRDGVSLNDMWVRNRTTRTNGVSYIIQKGALAVFSEEGRKETEQLLSVYRENAQVFMKALDEAGIRYTGGTNAPYIWVKCPEGFDSWQYFDLLLENAQIVGTPGAGFGKSGEGYFRFSMFADPQAVITAGERIASMKTK